MNRTLSILLPSIAVFIVGVSTTFFFCDRLMQQNEINSRLILERELVQFTDRLGHALNYSNTSTQMLAYIEEQNMLPFDFEGVASQLFERFAFIDALQIVRGDTIIHTYPLLGNEVTIGYGVGKVAQHFREMEKAKERNQLYFEGPFELLQGGTGFVGRLPIWKGDTLWGYAAAIIRYNTFLDALGLDENGEQSGFQFQLIKRDPYIGDVQLFGHDIYAGEGLVINTLNPMGDWDIYVRKLHPEQDNSMMELALLGIFVSLLLALMVGFLAAQPQQLRAKVAQRTAHLKRSNQKLQEYTFHNAHIVRAPLTNILALIPLLEHSNNEAERKEFIEALELSATNLDKALHVIQDIVKEESAID